VAAFLLRRAFVALVLLLGVAAMTFLVFYVVPGWGGRTTGQLAAQFAGRDPTPAQLTSIEHRMGFDRPLVVQFGNYLKALVVGADYPDGAGSVHCSAPCFGYSWHDSQQVLPLILDRLPVTLSIAVGAAVVWLSVGVAIGVASAVWRGSVLDRGTRILALLGVCFPVFFIGPLARWYLRGVFPRIVYSPFLANPVTWAQHLLLPWITLAFGYFALYARLTRAGMIDALSGQYVRTARAKGLGEPRVIRQALRAVVPSIVTVFAMDLGLLLGGAVLAEQVFSLHGIGELAANAVGAQNLPVVLGVTLFAGLFVVVANFAVDAGYAVLDPRIRVE
jgi:peptide/nickel transport system permease protein